MSTTNHKQRQTFVPDCSWQPTSYGYAPCFFLLLPHAWTVWLLLLVSPAVKQSLFLLPWYLSLSSPSLLCYPPAAHVSSVSQRISVPQDKVGFLLKAGPFLQVPEGSDVGWGKVPGIGGESSQSPLETPSPLKRRESLPCLCSLLVPILFNRLRLMSRGSSRDQPGCLIKGLQLSPAVWGFV